ncbi:A/G-specific adenine glycosylase [Aliikangiella maris]|uniref:A/G-specific adenine glycosylase n=2 Tax=Aliikangiella maris TaxID=3162458 RepID=A0ABV3MTK5_9GAMM
MLITPESFAAKILAFYQTHGRKDLPWQKNPTAYRVWVSEVMLQQTQVKTVIPYYQKFMRSFPTIKALANAPLDDVLHHWQGLGYYSRARNLHQCAQKVMTEFNGRFPKTLAQMESLPGIGRSTAGAILSLAMNRPTPILDGNVKRVLARVFMVDGWYGQSAVNKHLWDLTSRYTPQENTANFNQAMMDLGASFCSRSKPQCEQCPLAIDCLAYIHGKTAEYPHKKPKKTIPTKQAKMYLQINPRQQVLLVKRPPTGIWGGLWTLPQFSQPSSIDSVKPQSDDTMCENLIDEIKHTFTHFHLHAQVYTAPKVPTGQSANGWTIEETSQQKWHNINELKRLALPTPIKKFLFRYFQINE